MFWKSYARLRLVVFGAGIAYAIVRHGGGSPLMWLAGLVTSLVCITAAEITAGRTQISLPAGASARTVALPQMTARGWQCLLMIYFGALAMQADALLGATWQARSGAAPFLLAISILLAWDGPAIWAMSRGAGDPAANASSPPARA